MFLKHLQILQENTCVESLCNKVTGFSGHFEEHLWTTASVANTINSQNFIIICLKELKFYFTTIFVESRICNFNLKKMDSIVDVFVSWKLAANEQMNRTPSFKKCNKTKLLAVTLLKKIHHSCLMSKFSEILILACKKKCYLLFIRFCIKFFPIAVFSPLCILGFNFHTLWLQVLLHQKLPLLSYDLKAVSLHDKDVKSLSPISSYKTLFINSEADICSCSSK